MHVCERTPVSEQNFRVDRMKWNVRGFRALSLLQYKRYRSKEGVFVCESRFGQPWSGLQNPVEGPGPGAEVSIWNTEDKRGYHPAHLTMPEDLVSADSPPCRKVSWKRLSWERQYLKNLGLN